MHDATLVYFFRENGQGREVCLGLKKKSLKNSECVSGTALGAALKKAKVL